jgi:SprT-like protein
MNVKHIELVEEAQRFLKENFEMELGVPIEFNTRLKRTMGMFRYKRVNKKPVPAKIQMSVEFMKIHPKEHIMDVLRHELVHYALCAKGYTESQFSDGHHVFESTLKKLNVSPTRTYGAYGKMHLYSCSMCKTEFKRQRRIPATSRCTCSVHSKIIYHGEIELDFEGKVASKGE